MSFETAVGSDDDWLPSPADLVATDPARDGHGVLELVDRVNVTSPVAAGRFEAYADQVEEHR